ncbi:MAG TPA: PilZ domain-containing protein [Anaeromyxobacter sp.]
MPNGGEESRRFPRLLARCRVRIRDRFGVWDAETEDVGPRGCRIVTARPQTVGALVSLTLESDRVPEALEVAGQIVWARAERPARAGISYAGSPYSPAAVAPSAWFEIIVAAEREARGGSPGPEIVIVVEGPVPAPDPLVDRLRRRAEELLGGGEPARAAVLLRRVLALAPGDAAVEAALRDLAAR